MNFKKIDGSPKTFILVFQTGDELAAALLQFATGLESPHRKE